MRGAGGPGRIPDPRRDFPHRRQLGAADRFLVSGRTCSACGPVRDESRERGAGDGKADEIFATVVTIGADFERYDIFG
ncbi:MULTISPECIES: hypothetical protein [unclassified Streptomyces]|uniref:hypothetical protein n=1 Tax=unclassified Streptomyces TaxID=2593676 RepID=UPI002251FD6B|nr:MULTISPECIES: hypothetical protein [unclassified Streptomyces]MCX4407993.1 hypothetical protein [Streptomyces sp. NBC_01764]MCX5187281.1 hypothetical protein [Streptomyces sp. NBC_00268]